MGECHANVSQTLGEKCGGNSNGNFDGGFMVVLDGFRWF